MSEVRFGLSKVSLEFTDGTKLSYDLAAGSCRVGSTSFKSVVGQETPPPFRSIQVSGRIDDSVIKSDPPKSILENDEVANGIDD